MVGIEQCEPDKEVEMEEPEGRGGDVVCMYVRYERKITGKAKGEYRCKKRRQK